IAPIFEGAGDLRRLPEGGFFRQGSTNLNFEIDPVLDAAQDFQNEPIAIGDRCVALFRLDKDRLGAWVRDAPQAMIGRGGPGLKFAVAGAEAAMPHKRFQQRLREALFFKRVVKDTPLIPRPRFPFQNETADNRLHLVAKPSLAPRPILVLKMSL